jgi:hypothetical protein
MDHLRDFTMWLRNEGGGNTGKHRPINNYFYCGCRSLALGNCAQLLPPRSRFVNMLHPFAAAIAVLSVEASRKLTKPVPLSPLPSPSSPLSLRVLQWWALMHQLGPASDKFFGVGAVRG